MEYREAWRLFHFAPIQNRNWSSTATNKNVRTLNVVLHEGQWNELLIRVRKFQVDRSICIFFRIFYSFSIKPHIDPQINTHAWRCYYRSASKVEPVDKNCNRPISTEPVDTRRRSKFLKNCFQHKMIIPPIHGTLTVCVSLSPSISPTNISKTQIFLAFLPGPVFRLCVDRFALESKIDHRDSIRPSHGSIELVCGGWLYDIDYDHTLAQISARLRGSDTDTVW